MWTVKNDKYSINIAISKFRSVTGVTYECALGAKMPKWCSFEYSIFIELTIHYWPLTNDQSCIDKSDQNQKTINRNKMPSIKQLTGNGLMARLMFFELPNRTQLFIAPENDYWISCTIYNVSQAHYILHQMTFQIVQWFCRFRKLKTENDRSENETELRQNNIIRQKNVFTLIECIRSLATFLLFFLYFVFF